MEARAVARSLARPARRGTVAWVESPFQLLSLIEATHAGLLHGPVEGHLRGRPDMYRSLVRHLERHPVDGLELVPEAQPSEVRRRVRHAGELAVGDLCSGQIGGLLIAEGGCKVVVLDDGSSTLVALDALVSPIGTLVRPRDADRRVRSTVGRAVHRAARSRLPDRLRAVTSLPVPPSSSAAGLRVDTHRFGWSRAASVDVELADADVVICGSALPVDGLIDVSRYREWLGRQLDLADRPAVYLPHRRGDASSVDLVRRRGGVVRGTGGLPVELVGWTPTARVATLPSTAALTLPVVAPGLAVSCWDVPPGWWTEQAAPAMRDLADRICALHGSLASGTAPGTEPRPAFVDHPRQP